MKTTLYIIVSLLNIQIGFAQINIKDSINGIWQMDGYGKIIEIGDNEVNTYDNTKISCIINSSLKRSEINQLGKFKVISKDTINLKLGITNYYLHRIKELPKEKFINDSIQRKNLKLNFDVFWHTLNENYAFFNERKLDWQSIRVQYKNKLDTIKNELELYEILIEITDKLNDEHTSVRPTEDVRNAYEGKSDSLEETESTANLTIAELEENILNKYVKDPIKYGKSLYGNGLLNYGVTENNIGYIQLNNMIFFSDYGISDSLSGYDFLFAYLNESNQNPNYQEDEIEGIRKFMSSIVDKFKSTDAIILDLRFNYGGYDVVALEILKHFIHSRTKVFSKKAKTITGFTEPQSFIVTPTEKTYNKPVFFLTSHQTSSAPESLLIASMPVKNIKIIGSRTMGITSDVLEKKLPNGWDLYLSNEILTNYKGDCFEQVGIPADIEVDYPKDEAQFIQYLAGKLNNGDEAIEKVFELVGNK